MKHALMNLSYATSRSYPAWLISSIFIFIPFTILAAAIIKGPLAAPPYLIGRARKLNFTRTAFQAVKASIDKQHPRH